MVVVEQPAVIMSITWSVLVLSLFMLQILTKIVRLVIQPPWSSTDRNFRVTLSDEMCVSQSLKLPWPIQSAHPGRQSNLSELCSHRFPRSRADFLALITLANHFEKIINVDSISLNADGVTVEARGLIPSWLIRLAVTTHLSRTVLSSRDLKKSTQCLFLLRVSHWAP